MPHRGKSFVEKMVGDAFPAPLGVERYSVLLLTEQQGICSAWFYYKARPNGKAGRAFTATQYTA